MEIIIKKALDDETLERDNSFNCLGRIKEKNGKKKCCSKEVRLK